MSHVKTQLSKHIKNRIEEYRFKLEVIKHQSYIDQTYFGKNMTELKADLYKEYCNEVFYYSSGWYNPISYTSFFILLDNQQGYFE